ncbi:MAG: tRNA preQ1(34) S-adenosylmethionine ribosyltransferase-isomerase QueA [Proteobacteria bacterium]|nr:tRNA preQ1(34) S-adenosylmethionine ribosyltransferase-isomerase QueA [Pseudomonadota bacterium]
MYELSDYNYDLPVDLIAERPTSARDSSRLLCLNRQTGQISHQTFSDISSILMPSDLLVLNNTEVIPARLFGRKDTGGKVEVLILDYTGGSERLSQTGCFESTCLMRASKAPRVGSVIHFDQGLTATVLSFQNGIYLLRFETGDGFEDILYRIGEMPLPPYIRRDEEDSSCDDRISYQTVYANCKGAVAAPTAGLHFTRTLLEALKTKGIDITFLTLHVGYGTFLPVRVTDIREHVIHKEKYSISEETAALINRKKTEGKKIVAVGTTSVRTLEYAADDSGRIRSGKGDCDLFIYPGYRFKVVDKMITNFHLPKSTLLMLVSAFAGHANILNAYRSAIENQYRFYSYGDAMLIA